MADIWAAWKRDASLPGCDQTVRKANRRGSYDLERNASDCRAELFIATTHYRNRTDVGSQGRSPPAA